MSIELIIRAESFSDLVAKMGGFPMLANTNAGPATESVQAEVVDPPKRPRGRPAKNQVIEGTTNKPEEKPEAESTLATEAEAIVDETESPAEETSPVPEITHEELRTKIIAWVNDMAANAPKDPEARKKAFDTLRDEFDFAKVPEIDPAKFGGILAYLDANQP